MKKQTKRKLRIFSTLAAMALTLCMTCFGVFAAKTVGYSGSSTLTYSVNDISATLSGNWKKNDGTATELTFGGGNDNDGVLTLDWQKGQDETGTVGLPAELAFDALTDTFTIQITVQNTFTTDVSISSTLTATSSSDAVTVTVADGKTGAQTIAKGASLTYTVTIAVKTPTDTTLQENGFTGTFTLGLNLSRAS